MDMLHVAKSSPLCTCKARRHQDDYYTAEPLPALSNLDSKGACVHVDISAKRQAISPHAIPCSYRHSLGKSETSTFLDLCKVFANGKSTVKTDGQSHSQGHGSSTIAERNRGHFPRCWARRRSFAFGSETTTTKTQRNRRSDTPASLRLKLKFGAEGWKRGRHNMAAPGPCWQKHRQQRSLVELGVLSHETSLPEAGRLEGTEAFWEAPNEQFLQADLEGIHDK